tara:strand:- start:2606 stop:3697 length:1092 start_codon:yes stop_codon:yes gene_type:complete
MALPIITGIGKILMKTVSATAKGLSAAGKSTAKKSISGVRKLINKPSGELAVSNPIMEPVSNAMKTLKMNAERIKSNLINSVKEIEKQRLNKERIQRNILERKEIRDMEKNVTSTKTPTGNKVSSILKSPMGIVDKIFGFGGLLLTGIVVNAIDNIARNFKEFKKEGIFKFFGDMIKSVTNFIDNINFDMIAKYEDGKLTGGALKNIVDNFNSINKMARIVATVISNGIGGSLYGASKTGEKNALGRSPEQMGRVERFFAGLFDATTLDIFDADKQGRIYNLFKNPEEPKTWNQIINQIKGMNIDTDKLQQQLEISGVEPDVILMNQEIINNIAVPTESGNNGEMASSRTQDLNNPLWTGVVG